MSGNFFLITFRHIRKKSGYLLINVGGLAIGLASFLFIALYVINELTYDRFHANYLNIYRVKVTGIMAGGELNQAITAAPMAQAMLNDYPEIVNITRLTGMGAWLIGYGDKKFNEDGVLFADSTIFEVFDFKMLKGDPRTALTRPRSMVLTEEYAGKYFGSQDPLGQRLTVESDTVIYTVTGVVQNVPDNSHIKFDILASMSTYPGRANNTFWISHNFYTYFTLRDGTDQNAFEEKLEEMVIKYVGPQLQEAIGQTIDDFRNAGNNFRYVLEPLKDIHLYGATQYNLEPSGSPSTVYIFIVVALLILVIAIINYVNLATARAAGRAKEVGVKKVSGANNTSLVLQFLAESIFIAVIAGILAVLLVHILTPAFNTLTGKQLSAGLFYSPAGILYLLSLIILVGIASGFYPAFILASFNPVDVLKGTLSPGSMSKRMRWIMVVFQFAVSVVIIIGSIIVYSQLNFITKKDLGFDKDNLIIIRRPDAFFRQTEAFRTQLLQIPGVSNAAFSRNVPGETFSNNAFFNDDDPDKKTYLINQASVSLDYPEVLGVKLVEGRFFSRDFGADSSAIMINEAAVRSLGLTDPVGKYILQPSGPKQFNRLQIIGVMKDFNIESLHKAITPVCFTIMGFGGGDQFATVRLTARDIPGTLRSIEELWKKFAVNQPFQYEFFNDKWNNLYSSELRTGRLFIIFAILAIFIASLGLLGLVTFITNKRTKEIGIRKTYGASTNTVLGLLTGEIIYLIIISSLIAYPVAFFGSRYWLESFASRVSINPLLFIVATIIVLVVGWLSVSYQAIKASAYNPAQALKVE
jgi:putative ABC transport system permease protein